MVHGVVIGGHRDELYFPNPKCLFCIVYELLQVSVVPNIYNPKVWSFR